MPAKGGKKGRKINRNLTKCKKYRDSGIREKNKTHRIAKEKRRQERLQKYKTEILAGIRPETKTHRKAA